MLFWSHPESDSTGEDWDYTFARNPDGNVMFLHEVIVTQEMIDACAVYINFVREQVKLSGARLYVEQRVPIGHITGEEGAGGTSDVVMAAPTVLTTVDLKLGRGKVTAYEVLTPAGTDIVTGEPTAELVRINLQLALYLLGAMQKYPGDYTHVKAIIVQPYLQHVSEYSCTVQELLTVGEWLKERAEATRSNPVFAPDQDNCHFCKAAGKCEAQTREVLTTALLGFEDVDTAQPVPIGGNKLGSLYAAVPMIQAWCKQVAAHTLSELHAGNPVMRNDGLQYKLVVGKKGNRQFADDDAAEAVMKALRLKSDQMYTRSLISPSAAEKLSLPTKQGKTVIAPPVLSERQWAKLEAHITQSPGSPTIALETDPRPAIASSVADFDDVVQADDCSDLFS